ncbi:caspase family protein [Mesorhizobium sp. NZP2077]|uniref:caspase family protein n=1 Tax=Mesorhizobium sp. NZP2077 TaxID=2483404 RepID=UPI0015526880|nr:caspase family protein [Mesorhizobium sp. NZP2077]QKD19077.1 peptidase C14 [Mesorhizobium sp. NZP2077]
MAEKRSALVLGDAKYQSVRELKNTVADATAMKDALRALGFDVTLEIDKDLRRTRRALEDFRQDAAGSDVALVYFAGHGAEIDGDNRLLPTDTDVSSLDSLKASTLPLNEVRDTVTSIAKVGLVILDACRDDPFGAGDGSGRSAVAIAKRVAGSVKPGLGRVGRAENVLFAFSAAPGETAADGDGEHSPFNAALTKYLGTEGLEIRSVLTLVQQEVYDQTRGKQLPYIENGLPQLFFAEKSDTPLPERERLLLAMADITPDLRTEIETIAAGHDMPLAPLYGAAIESGLAQAARADQVAQLGQAADAFVKTRNDLKTLASDDPDVVRQRAEAENKLTLGEFDAARAAFGKAIGIDAASRDKLKANFIERTLSQVASLSLRAGGSLVSLKYQLAIEDYRAASVLFDDLTDTALSDGGLRNKMMVQFYLGQTLATVGNAKDALTAYQHAVQTGESRVRRDPRNLSGQREWSAALVRLANSLRDSGQADKAYDAYNSSLVVMQRLVGADPHNAQWENDLGASLHGIALLETDRGNLAEAERLHQQAAQVSRALIALEPNSPIHRRELAVAQMSLGDLVGSVGNSQAALPAYQDGLKTLEEAVALAPPNTFNQDLVVMHLRVGLTLLHLRRNQEAAAEFQQGEEIARQDIENDPNNDDFARAYAAATSQLAAAQLATGDVLGAVATYRRAVAFIGPNARDKKGEWLKLAAIGNGGLGDACAAVRDVKCAYDAYHDALEEQTALVHSDPRNVFAQMALALYHKKLGDAGDNRRVHYQAALDILLQLKAVGALPPAYQSWIDLTRQAVQSAR